MLLYFRLQNSGQPLHGTVLLAAGALLVELAVRLVPFAVDAPRTVSECDFADLVICESEAEADWLLELLPVKTVRSTVLWPCCDRYVYCDPSKSEVE